MLMINGEKGINLQVVVGNVFSWDILLEKKGWKVFDVETKQLFVSRDVQFFEHEYPFINGSIVTYNPTPALFIGDCVLSDDEDECYEGGPRVRGAVNEDQQPAMDDNTGCSDGTCDTREPAQSAAYPVGADSEKAAVTQPAVSEPQLIDERGVVQQRVEQGGSVVREQGDAMGKGMRTKYANVKYRDFVTTVRNNKSPSPPPVIPVTTFPSGMVFTLTHFVDSHNFSQKHRNYIAAISAGNEPNNFKEAMRYEG